MRQQHRATNTNPAKAATAPTTITKKSCQSSGVLVINHQTLRRDSNPSKTNNLVALTLHQSEGAELQRQTYSNSVFRSHDIYGWHRLRLSRGLSIRDCQGTGIGKKQSGTSLLPDIHRQLSLRSSNSRCNDDCARMCYWSLSCFNCPHCFDRLYNNRSVASVDRSTSSIRLGDDL